MIRRLDVRIVLVLIVAVLLPMWVSIFIVSRAIETSLGLGLNSEIASHFDQALEIRREHIQEVKRNIQIRFDGLSKSHALAMAVNSGEESTLKTALEIFLKSDPLLRTIRLIHIDGTCMESESAQVSTIKKARAVPLAQDIDLGPYNKIEAIYEVDTSILDAYKKSGEDFATYRALVAAPPNYLEERFIWVYLAVIVFAAVLSMTMGIIWARRLARRIHILARATTKVAEGDLSVRVDSGSKDEVGRLVKSFNGMVEELSVNRARIEYLQKISAWQEMARRLAHEIKNPLTPIQLAAQQLKEKYPRDDPAFGKLLDQSTEIISEEVATLRRLTSDFSSFAKLPEVKPESVNLSNFLSECEASLKPVTEQEGVKIEFNAPKEDIEVRIDRVMMKRVVDNLVRNAAEALSGTNAGSPSISVSAKRFRADKRAEVMITIEDNGPGILPEHHPSIFDPYFTTKSEGTGLGLAISKKIVFEHGGRIWVDEGVDGGAVFYLVLPEATNN